MSGVFVTGAHVKVDQGDLWSVTLDIAPTKVDAVVSAFNRNVGHIVAVVVDRSYVAAAPSINSPITGTTVTVGTSNEVAARLIAMAATSP
jgi:hypothetical protein